MAYLVVGDNPSLLLAEDPVLLLLAYQHNLHCLKQILLRDSLAAVFNSRNGRLVHHVGQIRAHCAGGSQGNLLKIYRLIQLHILGVNL